MWRTSVITALLWLPVCVIPLYAHDDPPADLIKVTSSGFLAHEPDILPFGVIQHVHAEQMRSARQLQRQGVASSQDSQESERPILRPVITKERATVTSALIKPSRCTSPKAIPLHYRSFAARRSAKPIGTRSKLRLERKNAKHFKLFDADGEHLLDVKYHAGYSVTSTAQPFDGTGTGRSPAWKAVSRNPLKLLKSLKSQKPQHLKNSKKVEHFLLQL